MGSIHLHREQGDGGHTRGRSTPPTPPHLFPNKELLGFVIVVLCPFLDIFENVATSKSFDQFSIKEGSLSCFSSPSYKMNL